MKIIDDIMDDVFDYWYEEFRDYEIIICIEATQEWWEQFKTACLKLIDKPFINSTIYERLNKHFVGIDYAELTAICDMYFSNEVPDTAEWKEFIKWAMQRLSD